MPARREKKHSRPDFRRQPIAPRPLTIGRMSMRPAPLSSIRSFWCQNCDSVMLRRLEQCCLSLRMSTLPLRFRKWPRLDINTALQLRVIGQPIEGPPLLPRNPIAIVQDDGNIDVTLRRMVTARAAAEQVQTLELIAVVFADVGSELRQ